MMMMTTAAEMVATATAVVATATAAATTARSRSMAQCHFARAPCPCSPHSSPPTPTLTICPHHAPSRGAEKACPAPRRRTSALPSFLTSSRPPTFAPFHFILHLLCSSSSSVFFFCFEFSLDIALRVLYYPSLTLFFSRGASEFLFRASNRNFLFPRSHLRFLFWFWIRRVFSLFLSLFSSFILFSLYRNIMKKFSLLIRLLFCVCSLCHKICSPHECFL